VIFPPGWRARAWAALGEPLDLLVIGGGITGAGVLHDAALRGLRVALVEQGDFGSGTSSRSSKLIHGGLRYLRRMQLGIRDCVASVTCWPGLTLHLVTAVLHRPTSTTRRPAGRSTSVRGCRPPDAGSPPPRADRRRGGRLTAQLPARLQYGLLYDDAATTRAPGFAGCLRRRIGRRSGARGPAPRRFFRDGHGGDCAGAVVRDLRPVEVAVHARWLSTPLACGVTRCGPSPAQPRRACARRAAAIADPARRLPLEVAPRCFMDDGRPVRGAATEGTLVGTTDLFRW
jgi:glycerol-3-phosphate dehydrogenase